MRSAHEELRAFIRLRGRLAGEIALCAVVAAALYAVAPRLESAGPDARAVFAGAAGLFGMGVLGLVPRLVPVLRFRCPRCTRPFHAATRPRAQRPVVSLRVCAHCGFGGKRSGRASV